jgi:hypothetical protein
MTKQKSPANWGIELSKMWRLAGMGFPIDVRTIALEIPKQKFPDEPIGAVIDHGVRGIDGMLKKRKKKNDWVIAYDGSIESKGRTNFTLGHELGHYFLHRNIHDNFECGQDTFFDYNSSVSRKMEAEANTFASYLLMPIDDFRQQVGNARISLDLLDACARRYDTSFTATALKWLDFTKEIAIIVVQRDGFILWSYPSGSARKNGIYFSPGTPTPETSIENFSTLLNGNARRRVGAGVWHHQMEADESLILSDKYDVTIFLVQFIGDQTVEHTDDEIHDSFDFLTREQNLFSKK